MRIKRRMAACFSLLLILAAVALPARAEPRVLVDQAGREVQLPAQVERIVPLGNTPRMITYLGLRDKAVGIGSMSYDRITPVTAYAYANKAQWEKLPIVGTDAGGATDYYPEQIIALEPDLILCSYTAELADEIQGKTGTPTVVVAMGSLFQDDYDQALRILGEACGVGERAEEVIQFIRQSLKDLSDRTVGVADQHKLSVLGAAATFKGAHGIEGIYTNYPVFAAVHANDAAKGIADHVGALIIEKEQVLAWNPDVIFLDSSGVGLVKQDYQKQPAFYKALKAFEEGRVYQYPSSTSYYSNVEIPLLNAYFVGEILYPQQFKDVQFEAKAAEICGFFLDNPDYLAKLNESGAGYQRVDLEE